MPTSREELDVSRFTGALTERGTHALVVNEEYDITASQEVAEGAEGARRSEEFQGGALAEQNVFGDAPEAGSIRQRQCTPPPRRRLTSHSDATATAEECLSASNARQNQGRRIA